VPTAHANPSNKDDELLPPNLRLDEPGDNAVKVPIMCVLTRFGLRSPLYLLPTYLDYRYTMKQAARTPGLLRAAFLIENLTTCYSLSIWSSYDDIPVFGGNVPYHVDAARNVFRRLLMRQPGVPELWSTKWQLTTVSNNVNWKDFDLRGLILRMSY
jgi:hypothetical protein